ncbi:hypothetical protein KIN20_020223 [Parelaphostrongylus tenuis]|uniref:Uncharacterized protein n=1 Tax=Parelaphostrongylus tenuis TaxID=148309 RepID=A0AAD5N690_PARTN|nr:hypothetical protein KIN20_020223 [Parelaphostrongylus tenuis]
MKPHCIIVGGTLTALCDVETAQKNMKCDLSTTKNFASIANNYKSVSGTLTIQPHADGRLSAEF